MIVDAVVKTVTVDKDQRRVEVFSPKYPGKALVLLNEAYDGKTIKFITGWEDIEHKKRPITVNGGVVDDGLIGHSTLIRGMCVQCSGDETVYVIMDPVLVK